MNPADLTQVLVSCSSPDHNQRTAAERYLEELAQKNLPGFLTLLSLELANNDKPAASRQMAGLVLKNALISKDDVKKAQLADTWVNIDPNVRNQIKLACFSTLASPVKEARSTAAQVVSEIAIIEVPKNLWQDFIKQLLANVQQDDNEGLKQSSLEALGYSCEKIDPNVLATQSNEILTAVCKGMKDNSNDIKLAGCSAMFNCLEFVKTNFEKEAERSYIMHVVCELCVFNEVKVRVAALECLVKIAALYYDKLSGYMQKIFNITLEIIKKDVEPAGLQAVEFWSTICDEEMMLAEEAAEAEEFQENPTRVSQFFIRGALKFLVPVLTEALTRQEDEPDEDTWNVAMASATCLSLVATTVEDEVVPIVVPFVQANINSENWKLREAATIAFGAILEGPKSHIPQLIVQALPVLLQHLKDPVVYVKDTTAWTVGRICQLHSAVVTSAQNGLAILLQHLVGAMGDSPRVVANICWAVHNLALAFEEDSEKTTSPMSPFFMPLVEKLMAISIRDDADEGNLRCSAYEAINTLISTGAQDILTPVTQLLPHFIDRLEKTFTMQIVSGDDREQVVELQSLLCGVLQATIQKLGGTGIKTFADKLMALFLQVCSQKLAASVQEEVLMAIGALANAVEGDFEKYMNHFKPFLATSLQSIQAYQVCAAGVGLVGDIARALGAKMAPYCDEIMTLLFQALQAPALNREVKPPILSVFGDVALAINGQFVKYLASIMNILHQASGTTVNPNDYELEEYLNVLRESIFEAYTGIIQGLKTDNVADNLMPYVNHIVNFARFVAADTARSESVTRGVVGVLGDLASALGNKIESQLSMPFVRELIDECLKDDEYSDTTRDIANWARETINSIKKK